MSSNFLEEQIKEEFNKTYFSRGRNYYKEGRVQEFTVKKEGNIVICNAKVIGSDLRYKTEARFPLHGQVIGRVTSSCSCPVGYHCKHVVATLLFWAREKFSAMTNSTPVVHPIEKYPFAQNRASEWNAWLNNEVQSEAIVSEKENEDFPVFVLDISKEESNIQIMLTRFLKSGKLKRPVFFSVRKHYSLVSPDDKHLISQLQTGNYSHNQVDPYPSVIPLSHRIQDKLIKALVESGRLFLNDDLVQPVKLGEDGALTFDWQLTNDSSYQLVAKVNEQDDVKILTLASPWYIDVKNLTMGPAFSSFGQHILKNFLKMPAVPLEEVDKFSSSLKKSSKQAFLPTLSIPKVEEKKISVIKPCLRFYGITDLLNYRVTSSPAAIADLSFFYDDIEIQISDSRKQIQRMVEGKRLNIIRDLSKEALFLNTLAGSDLIPATAEYSEYLLNKKYYLSYLVKEEVHLNIGSFVDDLRKEGWKIIEDRSFPYSWAVPADDWYVDVEEGEKNSWFDVDLGVMVDDKKVSIVEILSRILDKGLISVDKLQDLKPTDRIHLTLAEGQKLSVAAGKLLPIMQAFLELHNGKGKGLSVNRSNLFSLSQLQGDLGGGRGWKMTRDAKALLKQIQSLEQPPALSPPKFLQAELRPYQLTGLSWMQGLREAGFGGILADDMGLGKTLQTIAHLLLEKEEGRLTKPALIIAPTSLMGNWKSEIEKFAPSLRALIYQGDERKQFSDDFSAYDIVLSTYPLLARDHEIFLKYQYQFCILDEAQMIKNAQAKASQVASEIDAQHRLCLTGTPMENHLGELWALFHFLSPGLLGSSKQFNMFFKNPIEKKGSSEQSSRLTRRVAPFILRRIKEEVAKELPPKTEIVHKIVIEGEQRNLYETIRATMHKKVQETVQRLGIAKSQIILLDALLKLRQVCCDPRLVKLESAANVNESAKLTFLIDLLQKLLEEKRKVILFSSFSSMLELIEEACKKEGIRYVKLVGDTKDRPEVIDSFQNGDVPLFLISLKAGGTGLNLTAADTVIHYDPWWNPAAEEQATDRAHRLGQQKPVFVYKLITEGTIEEKILALQEKKRALIDHLFEAKSRQSFSMNEEDLKEFFAPISSS